MILALLHSALAAPHAMVVGGVGIPNLLHAHAEIFFAERWSVELGGGWGLLPWTITAGVRWSPEATCWGCWEGPGFRLAPGLTAFVFPMEAAEGLVTLNLDAAFVWTSESGVGFTAGVKGGLGAAFGAIDGRPKIEPGLEIVPLQLGVIF